jgi:beta-fructofuranosidase
MSWYSAVSMDLVTWSAYGPQPALSPDQPYDHEGVFTGLVLPHGPQGEAGMMTAIYTSVSRVIVQTSTLRSSVLTGETHSR